ncbi:MAG: 2-oxo acid dehydrogenase subunit E2 [Deltaproteobacteria bacterium]
MARISKNHDGGEVVVTAGCHIERPTLLRQLAIDTFEAIPSSHAMTAFMELDVSAPCARIAALRAEGVRVSMFAHVVRSIARALAEHPDLNVVMHGHKIAFFDDVDVSIPVEAQTASGKYPLQLVIRAAQNKTATEIYAEIEAAKEEQTRSGDIGVDDRRARRGMQIARWLPRWLWMFVLRRVIRNARLVKKGAGTTLVTSVGKFADIPGFVTTFGTGPRGTTFAIGSIVDKPVVRDGEVVVRPVLALTALFNHDVVDGGPAARFGARLAELVEGVDELGSSQAPSTARANTSRAVHVRVGGVGSATSVR